MFGLNETCAKWSRFSDGKAVRRMSFCAVFWDFLLYRGGIMPWSANISQLTGIQA
jgi:hypothetical protein